MKYMLKRGMSLAMAVIMIFTFGSQTFADTWSDNYLNKNNEYNIIYEKATEIPEEYIGIDLFKKNFDVTKMTQKEKEFYDYLIEKEAKNYLTNSLSNEVLEDVKEELEDIVSGDKIVGESSMDYELTNIGNYRTLARSAPWWHLNTVSKVGGAINIAIGAGFALIGGGIAAGGIRALIAKVGAAEAKKLVKNVVVNKVKNQMIAWEMSGLVNKIGNGMVQAIMWATDPGAKIARMLDAKDPHPNNGYLELW